MSAFVRQHLDAGKKLRILDVGSQDVNGSYRALFDHPNWTYIGADQAAGTNVDIVLASRYCWKELEAKSFDVVISGQAFEHMEYFWVAMFEISRVLKQGGLCCIIAPSAGFEHRYPVDCWRFFPDGFRALCAYAYLEYVHGFTESGEQLDQESALWKDTVCIARKPRLSMRARIVFFMKQTFLRLTVRSL